MPNLAALIAAALLGLFLVGLLLRLFDQARLIRTLRRLREEPVANLQPGLRIAHGRLQGAPLLPSPFQKRPCLYYFFRVLAPEGAGKLRNLATGKQWTDVHLVDPTGEADVDAVPATVASPRRHHATLEGLRAIPPEHAAFFEQAGIDEKHLPRLPVLHIHEYTIEPGDDVYVTGQVRVMDGKKLFYRKKRSPLIVSAEPDIGYLVGLRHELFLYAALAPVVLLAVTGLAVLAFL